MALGILCLSSRAVISQCNRLKHSVVFHASVLLAYNFCHRADCTFNISSTRSLASDTIAQFSQDGANLDAIESNVILC